MSSATIPEFGPNDWFVQEKYEEYLTDPNSVDPIWREHFGRSGAAAGNRVPQNGNGAVTAQLVGTRPSASPIQSAPTGQSRAPADPAEIKQANEAQPAGPHSPLRGVAAAVVKNMTASLEVPTATRCGRCRRS